MRSQHFEKTAAVLMSLLWLAWAAQVSGASADKTSAGVSPQVVVDEFYKYHFSHDMAFTSEGLKQRAAWLTPELKDACQAYFALPSNPDEVPDIDGDPFTGSQEYPDTFVVGPATVTDGTARVPLTFTWTDDHHSTKGVAVLKKLNQKWLIDNVEFPDQDSIRTLLANQSAPAKP